MTGRGREIKGVREKRKQWSERQRKRESSGYSISQPVQTTWRHGRGSLGLPLQHT